MTKFKIEFILKNPTEQQLKHIYIILVPFIVAYYNVSLRQTYDMYSDCSFEVILESSQCYDELEKELNEYIMDIHSLLGNTFHNSNIAELI